MKRNNKFQILEFLKEVGHTIGELADIGLSSHGALLKMRLGYPIDKVVKKSTVKKSKTADEYLKKKKSVYMLLYRLKKDGLVIINNKSDQIKITDLGRQILEKLRLKSKTSLPIIDYDKKSDSAFKIVIFDIPEKDKRKREWLRDVLRNLGLNMLQKSVWAGKFALPEKFIHDLKKLNLLQYVEIFIVSKSGSLKHFV